MQEMQVVHLLRIERRERARKKIRLLLIVALDADAIPGLDHRLQHADRIGCFEAAVAHVGAGAL